MPRRSPSSGAAGADREGGALFVASVAAVAVVWLSNVAPPATAWWPALLLGAIAAGACGLRRWPDGAAWWALAGVCLGGCAGALAPRCPDVGSTAPVPVRFGVSVRDGWQLGEMGWTTRVRVDHVESATGSLRVARELRLTVAGAPPLAVLPAPGTSWEGAGELAYQAEWPLRRPQLRVKDLLLLRPTKGGSVVDRIRGRGVEALLAAAGTDPELLRSAGLASALVLGRTERLPSGEVGDLRRSGLAHLLAVSGLHVGLVGAFVWWSLLLAGASPRRRRWAVAAAMLCFAVLAGWGAPVRRASFAGAAYLTARQLGRPLLALPVVWGVVAWLVLAQPDSLLQAGFQLSALVTLALVRWVEPLSGRLGAMPRWAAGAAAVAVIGQAASTPLVGQHFGTFSPLSVPANLAASPVALILTVSSLVALAAAAMTPSLGHLALSLLAPARHLLDAIASATATGTLEYPAMTVGMLCVIAALWVWGLGRARGAAAAACASVVLWFAWLVWPATSRPAGAEVRMLPVRDGMALLLRSPAGAVLVDAGRSPLQASRALASERVRRLSAVVLTHPDADHTGGAARVLERFPVGALVYPVRAAEQPAFVALRRLAAFRGVPEQAVAAGQRVVLAGMPFDVLWPDRAGPEGGNDASLVARVRISGACLLVTGDIEAHAEAALLARDALTPVDILQLPHHGSATSSTAPFLAVVGPRVALAASGTSPRYRYPNAEVVRRLLAVRAVVMAQREGAEDVTWSDAPAALELDGAVSVSLRRREHD